MHIQLDLFSANPGLRSIVCKDPGLVSKQHRGLLTNIEMHGPFITKYKRACTSCCKSAANTGRRGTLLGWNRNLVIIASV